MEKALSPLGEEIKLAKVLAPQGSVKVLGTFGNFLIVQLNF
jgi:hypothetical protein